MATILQTFATYLKTCCPLTAGLCGVRFFHQNAITMKTAFLNIFFFIAVASNPHRPNLHRRHLGVPFWIKRRLRQNHHLYRRQLLLFHSQLPERNEYGIRYHIFLGVYRFDGSTLSLYDMKNDNRSSFPVTESVQDIYVGRTPIQECNSIPLSGEGGLDQNQQYPPVWENYRKLGGTWASSNPSSKFTQPGHPHHSRAG